MNDTIQAAAIVALVLGTLTFLLAPARRTDGTTRRFDAPELRTPVAAPAPAPASLQERPSLPTISPERSGVTVLYRREV